MPPHAIAYIDACGRKELDAVAPLLAPDMKFVGPQLAYDEKTAERVRQILSRRRGVVEIKMMGSSFASTLRAFGRTLPSRNGSIAA